jgi:hypothetical protein
MVALVLPFSHTTLQTALRHYLAQPSLELDEVVPKKLGGGFSGSPVYKLKITYLTDCDAAPSVLHLIFKQGAQSPGAISYSVAGREALFYRTLAPALPVRTPHVLLSAGDDPVTHPASHDTFAVGNGAPYPGASLATTDWVLIEALPQEGVWPQTQWDKHNYADALLTLAHLHAHTWDNDPYLSTHPWLWQPAGLHAHAAAVQARRSLLEIEAAPWGSRFFTPEEMSAWLSLLDNPDPLLDILNSSPQTLIHGDYWPGNIALKSGQPALASSSVTVFDWQFVGIGPAAYDLACFHSTSRWWFGRLPYTLTEMRALYLHELNTLLGHKANSALSTSSLDAARAWRFATFWPSIILQYHPFLLARRSYLRTTVLDPALSSLGRCLS